tara:strand:+ start:231 stop:1007 length:777 start_codon:yes stop_codon:yes gene_type:complete
MSLNCLHLTEATIGFPNGYDKEKTEVTLWGPETIHAMPGAAAWMNDPDAYRKILHLVMESGMHWEGGPHREEVFDIIAEMEEWEDHGTAYEKWCQADANMDDLHEKSLFTEWNQAEGCSTYVGADQMGKNMKIPEYTPEMLQQREDLNWFFNFKWNQERSPGCPNTRFEEIMEVPDQIELLELTAVGDNHGVAKCVFGAVFIPKGALTHLNYNGGATVGTIFDGEITFTPNNKFPWRLKKDGITFTYQDLCGTRIDDY